MTLATAGMALVLTEAGPLNLLRGWGGGFWSLHSFAMRMALVLFTGFRVAISPLDRRQRDDGAFPRPASLPSGRAGGRGGLPPARGRRLLRPRDHLARGLLRLRPLIAAAEAEALTQNFGVVPINQTLFSPLNLGVVLATFLVLPALVVSLHPSPADTLAIDPARLASLRSFTPPTPPERPPPAARLDFSPFLPVLVGVAALGWVGLRLGDIGWRKIDIDLVNFTFLGLALLLHRTPAAVLAAAEEAGSVLSGIVLQFPFYTGIYGMFEATRLTGILGDLLLRAAPPPLFPALVYLLFAKGVRAGENG